MEPEQLTQFISQVPEIGQAYTVGIVLQVVLGGVKAAVGNSPKACAVFKRAAPLASVAAGAALGAFSPVGWQLGAIGGGLASNTFALWHKTVKGK